VALPAPFPWAIRMASWGVRASLQVSIRNCLHRFEKLLTTHIGPAHLCCCPAGHESYLGGRPSTDFNNFRDLTERKRTTYSPLYEVALICTISIVMRNTLDMQKEMFLVTHLFNPAIIGIRFRIQIVYVGFDIKKWGSIKHVQA
jgi:hypothetical protein